MVLEIAGGNAMNCSPQRTDLSRRARLAVLKAAWVCGLLAGCIAARALGTCFRPGFSDAGLRCSGRLLGQVLCSAALQWAFPGSIPAAAFFGGAALAYGARGVSAGFGSAGWLLWPVFLFSELALCPFLFFAWLQPAGRRGRDAYLLAAAAAIVIGLADHRLVMPFGAFLIELE